jgi:hypothetical protein
MNELEAMPKTVPERLSAIEAHVTIIRERADEDRADARRRADETSKILSAIDMNVSLAAAETKRIGSLLTEGEARFKTHEVRITALETWRTTHNSSRGTTQKLVSAGWAALISALTVAGIYLGFLHGK